MMNLSRISSYRTPKPCKAGVKIMLVRAPVIVPTGFASRSGRSQNHYLAFSKEKFLGGVEEYFTHVRVIHTVNSTLRHILYEMGVQINTA